MSEALSHIDLTQAEIASLPKPIRAKIESAFGPVDRVSGKWVLVGSPSAATATVVAAAIKQVATLAQNHLAARQEDNIERLLEIVLEDTPRADVDIELKLENVEMRAEYLSETKLLRAQDIRQQSGLTPRNKSEPASRWKREKKIFAVRRGGIDLYPAFQFVDGQPHPTIKKILSAFGDDFTPWQIAFWFESGNGWLDGEEPQNSLGDEQGVVTAARRLSEPTIG